MGRDKEPKSETPAPIKAAAANLVAEAFALIVAAREKLLLARAARGEGVDTTADAGALAEALLQMGGALPDDTAPWVLAHPLADLSGMPDKDGTELLARFVTTVIDALRATRRRKALNLPAPGLQRFAAVAVKHATRKGAVEELEALKATDQIARDLAHRKAHEARGDLPAVRRPDGPQPPDRVVPEEDDARV